MGKLKALDPMLHEGLEDVFYNDVQGPIDRIVDLIKNNIQPPYSIAVNGAWGAGKTTVLKAIKTKLETESYPVIWFNPWEYDNSGDVVLALQKRIATEFNSNFGIALKEMGIFALSLFTTGISALANKVAGIDYEGTKVIENDVREALLAGKYEAYDDVIEATKNDFIKLSHKVSQVGKYKDKPLIIILDDLDRCLPENALKLLEALKNQFVARNEKEGDEREKNASVIIISGIDTGVAKQFISERYKGLDPNFAINYFRKVFNLTIELPNKDQERFENFISTYINDLFDESSDDLIKAIYGCANAFGVRSVRTILNVINNLYVSDKMKPAGQETQDGLLIHDILALLFLRETHNQFYDQLCVYAQQHPKDTIINALKIIKETEKLDRAIVERIKSIQVPLLKLREMSLL